MTALWVVNFFYMGIKRSTCGILYVPYGSGSAESEPAAAVIRRIRALSGFIVFKGSVGGFLSQLCEFACQQY